MYKLAMRDDTGATVTYPLDEGVTLIGRAPECEIVLTDPGISSRHASIRVREGRVSLKDYESTNGTYVNDFRVRDSVDLSVGDEVIIVNYRFFLRKIEDAAREKTVRRKRPAVAVETGAGWLGRLFGRRREERK